MNEQGRTNGSDEAPTSEPSTLISISPDPPEEAARTGSAPHDEGGSSGSSPASVGPEALLLTPEPGTAKRVRPKLTLRIPDDEVARPSRPSSVGPPSSVPYISPTQRPPIMAQRIINLSVDTPTTQIPVSTPPPSQAQASVGVSANPVPVAAVVPTLLPRPPSIVSPQERDDATPRARQFPSSPHLRSPGGQDNAGEDSWTPFQPMAIDKIEEAAGEPAPRHTGVEGPIEAEARVAIPPAPLVYEEARALPAVSVKAGSVEAVSVKEGNVEARSANASPAPSTRSPGAGDDRDDFPEMVFDDDLFPSSQRNANSSPPSVPRRDVSEEDRVTVPRVVRDTPTKAAAPPAPSPKPAAPRPRRESILDPLEVDSRVTPPTAGPAKETGAELDASVDIAVDSAPRSEPAELSEVSPEDVVSVEAVAEKVDKPRTSSPSVPPPPMRPRAASIPGFSAAVSPPAAPPPAVPKTARTSSPGFPPVHRSITLTDQEVTPPKPRPIVLPAASPLAPPPMSEAASSQRKKARPWWEDLFNDDFIRTMAKISDRQIFKEVDFIEESLGLDKGAMVLDLACGTGRHAIELTRRGYQVVGFDLSLAMLAKAADEAQDRQQKINFVQGDMRDMTFDGTFDGVYCWSTSFGFFEEEKNAAVIANVRRALKPGGQFLLDVVNRDYVAQECPSLVWFEGDGCVCMDDMTIDWITSRMKIKRTMMMDDGRSREIEYSIRLYALHELGKLLHENGFRVSQVSGRVATPGVFFGANSPRTLILAEKK